MSFITELPVPFFALAPLDDVSDTVFRQIIAGCALPDLFFTEFVNVDGLQSAGRPKLLHKLQFTDRDMPLIVQLWGKNPGNYEKTAREIASGSLAGEANGMTGSGRNYAGVDINMGCPDKSICSNGCCAALINDRELAAQIINAVRTGLDGALPLSVKTRIGYNAIDMSWIEFLLGQNLDMLTVHGRTKREMSKVPNHWEVFDRIISMRDRLSPRTKIVGNGDVHSRQLGVKLAADYKFDGLMIGRGALADPYVFAKSSPWPAMQKAQRLELFDKHISLFDATWQNDERRLVTLNKFCKIYVNNFDGAVELRVRLMAAGSVGELRGLIREASIT